MKIVRLALLRSPAARFYGLAAAIVLTCLTLTRSPLFARNPDVAAWGVTFDLTITIPLLYWFLIVRPGKARALTLAPIVMLGMLAAAFVLPRTQQHFLGQLKMVASPIAEVLLIGALIQRIRRFERSESSDPYDRIFAAARTIAGDGRVAEVIASEITLFYYALFCWRKKPDDNPRALTFHQRHGWSMMLGVIFLLIAVEGTVVHLLLARWNTYAAWTWTLFDCWAVFWLLGDFHALRLRRTTLDDEALRLHYGMRWSATIDAANIASVEEVREERQWKQPGILKVAILDEPRWLITFREPVVLHGLAGLRKTIHAVAMLPDDDSALRQWKDSLPH